MENIFVARQPIFDKKNNLYGYELLYRAGDTDVAEFENGTLASTQMILNSFLDIGFDCLVGSSFAFINITEDFILDESLTPMYEKQTVLEVLEHIYPSAEIVEGVKRLKSKGYRIALDDFKYSPEYDDLLSLADFVKIDVIALNKEEIIQELNILKKYNIKTIAEKVETHEMCEYCEMLDFDFFQGFYFCKPQLVKKKSVRSNKLVVLNLLNQLSDAEYSFDEIEKAVAQDATLTYKLLRYVNSAAFASRREIDSIKEALVLVGGDTIRKWASLILMMQLAEGKPQSLLVSALVRARMCELLEKRNGKQNGHMFTVGLLSLLDALMNQPLEDILDELTLSSSVKFALLDYEGENGEILRNVIQYEQGQWAELVKRGVDAQIYFSCYMEGVKWADASIKQLS